VAAEEGGPDRGVPRAAGEVGEQPGSTRLYAVDVCPPLTLLAFALRAAVEAFAEPLSRYGNASAAECRSSPNARRARCGSSQVSAPRALINRQRSPGHTPLGIGKRCEWEDTDREAAETPVSKLAAGAHAMTFGRKRLSIAGIAFPPPGCLDIHGTCEPGGSPVPRTIRSDPRAQRAPDTWRRR